MHATPYILFCVFKNFEHRNQYIVHQARRIVIIQENILLCTTHTVPGTLHTAMYISKSTGRIDTGNEVENRLYMTGSKYIPVGIVMTKLTHQYVKTDGSSDGTHRSNPIAY